MISHEYRFIFIHIPFTDSHFVEDITKIKVSEKHRYLTSSQAKELYAEYWDDYYKFSIVRDPYMRVLSSVMYPKFSKITLSESMPWFTDYYNLFGYPKTVEFDHRFYSRENIPINPDKIQCGSPYGNFLSEEIDRVFKIEEGKRSIQQELIEKIKIPFVYLLDEKYEPETLPKIHLAQYIEITNLYEQDLTRYEYPARQREMPML